VNWLSCAQDVIALTTDGIKIVAELREGLSRRIGRQRFDLWFQTGVRLTMQGNTIVVAVSDQFILERLRKQFLGDLRAVGKQQFGQSPQVDFFVEESLQTNASAETVSAQATPLPQLSRQGNEGGNETAGAASGANETGANETISGKSLASRGEPPCPRARRRFASLESYVVGGGNRLAFTAAQSITQRPGHVTPLYLHGPTGCGKTHLLEGVWSAMRSEYRSCRALYLSAEQFTSYFLEALHGGGLPGFRRKTRDVDLLLVDDVQFFAGKRATIVELQNTIDTLVRSGRQLVLAGDRAPNALTELGPEFNARVSGGLVCSLDAADFDTRLGITSHLAVRMGIPLTTDVRNYIATKVAGDGRQIAGSLNRLRATSEALKQPITLDLAVDALQDILQTCDQLVQLADIEKAVCSAFGVTPKLLRDDRKSKAVSHPRMLAMWLARKYTRAASSEISNFFGRRSHSTVISAEKKVNGWVANGATVQVGPGSYRATDAIRRAELLLRSG
jgi:chromosomal replication initiator protein